MSLQEGILMTSNKGVSNTILQSLLLTVAKKLAICDLILVELVLYY